MFAFMTFLKFRQEKKKKTRTSVMDFTLLLGSLGNILVGCRQTLVSVSAPTFDLTCLSRSDGPDSGAVKGVAPHLVLTPVTANGNRRDLPCPRVQRERRRTGFMLITFFNQGFSFDAESMLEPF